MIKNIIFDWSGVINDSVKRHLFIVNKIFREFGAQEISLAELKENWEQPYMGFYHKYLPNLTLEQEHSAYKKAIAACVPGKPYLGIVGSLKKFKAAGIKMAVLSSDLAETLLPEIKNFGLEGYFVEVIADVDDKSAGLRALMEKHNFKNEETIFIGDSNHETEVGKNAGTKTGAITWGFCARERLNALKPDFMIDNLDNLESAVFQ